MRDLETGLVSDEVNPLAKIVMGGTSTATKKFDGSCCLWHEGQLWKRRVLRVERPEGEGTIVQILVLPSNNGHPTKTEAVKPLSLPDGFLGASDVIWNGDTGKIPGWLPISDDDPADQYHREAAVNAVFGLGEGGTYELCGPKVQGNPQDLDKHALIEHGAYKLWNVPIDFGGLKEYLQDFPMEGVVWWHDGIPVAKAKRKDLGLPWPIKEDE